MNKNIVLFLLAVTAHRAESSYAIGSYWPNFSYYKNLGIKTISYPFVQFWNSTRSTKVAIGAVGGLLIAGYLLRSLPTDIINNELNSIEKNITSLEKIQSQKNKQTLISQHNNSKKATLIKNINDKIIFFDTTYSLSSDGNMQIITEIQKKRFDELKKRFENLKNNT